MEKVYAYLTVILFSVMEFSYIGTKAKGIQIDTKFKKKHSDIEKKIHFAMNLVEITSLC